MRARKLAMTISVAAAMVAVPTMAGAVGGLSGPIFGIDTAPNGDVLVADASTGIVPLRDGAIGDAVAHLGASDVSAIGRGSMWVLNGAGADPEADTGQALYRVSEGRERMVANLWEFEATVNPDGNDPFDSNPFDVQSLGGGAALVVDAGGNDLLRVDNEGDVEVLAVFHDELNSTANIKDLAGCPTPPPEFAFVCGLPPAIPGQAVPTSIAIGPDGWIYVGELAGFPAPTDESDIWRVAPWASWADCDGTDPDCQLVFDGGFTSIMDLAFGPDGDLYVVEFDEASWAAVEILGLVTGGTVNRCDLDTMTCGEVATDQPMPTAITFGKDGTLWLARNALAFGNNEVVALP
jgi:hypothetical protein